MSHRPSITGLRAILRSGDPTDRDTEVVVELYETVGDALAAGIRQLRLAGSTGRRAALDVGEVGLPAGSPLPASDTRSAALLGAAGAGQLLLSGAAASIAEHLPEGVTLEDLGNHRFHGVPTAMTVFEARGAGLVSSSIRTIDTVGSSIPIPPTPLIGRHDVLGDVVSAIRGERVVTLTGSGGSGKTRLAIEAAAASIGLFDSIHWAELAPLGSDDTLVDELVALVGIEHQGSAGRRGALMDALGHGRRLLVLDNAEHVIDAVAGLVTEAAARCPALHLLVTSREPLGIAAEAVRRIPPLPVAKDDSAASIFGSDATVFLLDRLGRAGVETPLDDHTASQLHRICTRLDGIPLALELAAARASTVPLADLASGLDDRFNLLSATRRDAQPHQRTLDASIRWSYDLLTDDERITFRRLAVFSGSFEAADAVEVDGGPAGRVAESLDRLVERSLIAPAQDGRLRLSETVRAFAEDRLDESGETGFVRDRHLAWVVSRAADIAPDYDGPDPASAAERSRRLLNDARAAIAHAEHHGRADAIWSLVDHLALSCFYDGRIDEGLEWAVRATAIDDGTDPEAAASGLVAAALLATSRGDHDEIADAVAHGRAAADAAADQRSSGRALLLGAAHDSWHRPSESLAGLIEGSELCAGSGDVAWSAWGSCGAALALTFLGRPADAVALLDEADAAASTLRSRRLALDAAARRCICEYQLGRWGDAHRTIERGRRLAQGFTSVSVTACFDAVDAWLATARGHADVAAATMDQAIERYLRAGELQFIPLFVEARSQASITAGEPAKAVEDIDAIRHHPGVEWAAIYRHWLDHTLATALLRQGDTDGAREVAERLSADAADVGNQLDAARGNLLLARVDALDSEHRRSDERTADALDELWQLRAVPAVLDALELSAHADEIGGRGDRARAIAVGVREARGQLLAGTTPDLADLVELARRGRGDRRRPAFGWDSLTPTELLVAELVADGLTNPQIAERLIIGQATAKTHVSNVLRKLDMTRRTQVATAYHQRADHRRPG